MKFIYPFLFLFIVLTAISCVSTKQLTYLQENTGDTDTLAIMTKRQEPYRLQINDLLSIRVKTLDQEFVGIFNPISEANLSATGEEKLYYDGFVIDDHGNIRIPSLGEVNVLGYTVDEVREMLEERLLKD